MEPQSRVVHALGVNVRSLVLRLGDKHFEGFLIVKAFSQECATHSVSSEDMCKTLRATGLHDLDHAHCPPRRSVWAYAPRCSPTE
eukprot:7051165-Prorocentrum_lima.AAC.1